MLTLQPRSLNWALAHSMRYGDTDLFPAAFEFAAIKHGWSTIRPILEEIDLTEGPTRPERRCLAPKGRLGFRLVTQLDPLDFLLYAAAIKEIGPDIEKSRVPISKKTVFSYRFAPTTDGRIFNPKVGYPSFVAESRRLSRVRSTKYVAVTDIADFYSKIYHHPLENALSIAAPGKPHVTALLRFISGWSGRVSHGIPIGNAPSRLLAELAIADVDQALLGAQIRYVRFNDDYRLFSESYEEAYRHLAFLANVLYENHGLTLQPKKTYILDVPTFQQRFLRSPSDRAVDSLADRFHEILSDMGIDDPYSTIEYEELTRDQKAQVDSLNLVAMFRQEVEQDGGPDAMLLRFILRRMGQLNRADLIDLCLDNIDSVHQVLPDIIRYLSRLTGIRRARRTAIGRRLLELAENSILSELEYHRHWILHLFATSDAWNCSSEFVPLLGRLADSFSRRELILALGRSGSRSWFNSQRRSLFQEGPWTKRAFLAGASCLPADARGHWYRSVEPRLNDLERAVVAWAKAGPFP